MKNVMKGIFAGTIALGLSTFCIAQEADTRGYNPNSVRPIHESDIMFKKTVWQNVDLMKSKIVLSWRSTMKSRVLSSMP